MILQWCYNMKCVMIGERLGAIDGGWGSWSSWSRCSRSCGSGVAFATRRCDRPSPSNSGSYCPGIRKRYKICATNVSFNFDTLRSVKNFLFDYSFSVFLFSFFRPQISTTGPELALRNRCPIVQRRPVQRIQRLDLSRGWKSSSMDSL